MQVSFLAATGWGLAVLVAFIGWGAELGARLFPNRRADAGLHAAWGMSFTVFAGGALCMFDAATKPVVIGFVILGIVLACVRGLRGGVRLPSIKLAAQRWGGPAALTLLTLCLLGTFLQYLGSIANVHFSYNDDFIAYFPFAKQILQQGTLFDPFSTRRVMSFGGQSLLHAVVLAGSPGFRLHMLDQGVCLLITALLITGSRRDDRPAWPMLLALLLLLTMPDIRINTYPELSGVVVFYGLYRTMVWLDEGGEEARRPFAAAILVTLLATAACALRSNYIAIAIPLLALSYAHLVLRSKENRTAHWRETAYGVAFGLIFLVPWMVLSYRSSGTPLFPLIQGHFNQSFAMLEQEANFRRPLAGLLGTVKDNHILFAFPLFVLAGFLFPDRRARKPLHTLLLAGLFGWFLLVVAMVSDVPSYLRYVYAFIVAAALAITTSCAEEVKEKPESRRITLSVAQMIAVMAALIQLAQVGVDAVVRHVFMYDRVKLQTRWAIVPPEASAKYRFHHELQSHVPPGQRLLVMVNLPFMFDFARNDIYNVDTAAAVSPPPGFPYFRGPEAVATYLRGQSIRYLAFIRPDRALNLYRVDVWERERDGPPTFWRAQAPFYLDIFDNFAKLAATHKVLYDEDGLVLVDLAQPAQLSSAN